MFPVNGLILFLQLLCFFFFSLFLFKEEIWCFFYMLETECSSRERRRCAPLYLNKNSEPGVWSDLSVIEKQPGPFQDVIKSAVCLKSRWTWTLMRTRLSCKPWLEEVSHKGVTVSPGHWHSPPLCGVETASLQAAVVTRTLLTQTGQFDCNDICSCCEHGGQIVPCHWFEASKFLSPRYTSFNICLTFMLLAVGRNALF